MRSRYIWTRRSEVNAPESKAALISSIVAVARSNESPRAVVVAWIAATRMIGRTRTRIVRARGDAERKPNPPCAVSILRANEAVSRNLDRDRSVFIEVLLYLGEIG